MANNLYKRDYREDKFGRRFYCDNARRNLVRSEKKIGKRKTRRKNKKLSQNPLTNGAVCGII